MNMKRFLILSIALVLLFALTACSAKEKTEESSAPLDEALQGTQTLAQVESSESSSAASADADFVGERPSAGEVNGEKVTPAVDWSLVDQNGTRHKMADYKGKVVVLNFWQTWCPPCLAEMPDIQKVYKDLGENQGDVVILGVSSPSNELNTVYTQESKTDAEIKAFLDENKYSYPSLMDYTGELYMAYTISAFPTTIFINPDGNVFGFLPGGLSEANLLKFIDECRASSEK